MNHFFEDHGLPLVQLKEQRRDLIVALMGRSGPLPKDQIAQIAAVQQAIAAIEAVIVDLDAETCLFFTEANASFSRFKRSQAKRRAPAALTNHSNLRCINGG